MSHSLPDIIKAVHRCKGDAIIITKKGEATIVIDSGRNLLDTGIEEITVTPPK